jgi:hypothetical protein
MESVIPTSDEHSIFLNKRRAQENTPCSCSIGSNERDGAPFCRIFDDLPVRCCVGVKMPSRGESGLPVSITQVITNQNEGAMVVAASGFRAHKQR